MKARMTSLSNYDENVLNEIKSGKKVTFFSLFFTKKRKIILSHFKSTFLKALERNSRNFLIVVTSDDTFQSFQISILFRILNRI